jgi:hypothetical protein
VPKSFVICSEERYTIAAADTFSLSTTVSQIKLFDVLLHQKFGLEAKTNKFCLRSFNSLMENNLPRGNFARKLGSLFNRRSQLFMIHFTDEFWSKSLKTLDTQADTSMMKNGQNGALRNVCVHLRNANLKSPIQRNGAISTNESIMNNARHLTRQLPANHFETCV